MWLVPFTIGKSRQTKSRELPSVVTIGPSPKEMPGVHCISYKCPNFALAFFSISMSLCMLFLPVKVPISTSIGLWNAYLSSRLHTHIISLKTSLTLLSWVRCPHFVVPEDITPTSAETFVSISVRVCTLLGQHMSFISNTSLKCTA